jgi:hypothetical protein
MDFLVLIEEGSETSPVVAKVDSVSTTPGANGGAREVVTLYGNPSSESLALALAASVEGHRSGGNGSAAFQHLGVWPGRGAVGDAGWRDAESGEMITRTLEIPMEVIAGTAERLLEECGSLLRRLIAGLTTPDWPEGSWRAITLTIDSVLMPPRGPVVRPDGLLEAFREAEAFTFDYEGD